MKKKGIVIGVIVLVVILAIVIGLVFVKKGKNEEKPINQIITLDINPSIELDIQDGNCNRINPDGDEAWELINRDFEGKPLQEVLDEIVKNAVEKGYATDGELAVIVGLEEKDDRIEAELREACKRHNVGAYVVIPEITEEARHEAQGRGVTPAKAQVILEALKGNEELHFDDFKEKSAKELIAMKDTGLYCDNGYNLNGDKCEKIIKEEKPEEGKTCPSDYVEAKGKCYKLGTIKHEPYCKTGTLKDGKCVGTEEVAAEAKCSSGTYNSKSGKCEVSEYAGEGSKKCPSSEQKLLDNGRCASPHMGAHFDDPDGTIDPATECCCGDTWFPDSSIPSRGWCYSLAGNDDPIVTCPSGQTAKDGKCYKTTTSDATYSCSKGKLSGNKCIVETSKEPTLKVACADGFTVYEDRACVDYNTTTEFITGLTCRGDARLEGERCVYYEVVDAKGK